MTSRVGRIPASTVLVLVVWIGLSVALAVWAIAVGTPAAIGFCAAAPLLWTTGMRSFALWMRAAVRGRSGRVARAATPAVVMVPESGGAASADASAMRVALLYCVADDADTAAITASARQDVAVDVVVLDDSREPAQRARVDAAARADWTVVRRRDRRGFKAGNLNHGLDQLRGRYDAYVLCDADVVLPGDFVRRLLPALSDPTVAVVQAQPVARAGRTWFARYFGPLLRTHVAVTRGGRSATGVVALLGRGALVRATALDDVGGVPEVVAEDLALTVALRRRGWRLVDADVEFAEDYPVDYRSFRTQLRKTTEGAVEVLRSHARPSAWRGLPRAEARDLLLETALVPLTALAGAAALVAGAALAAGGTPPPLWASAASAIAAAAPLLPEAIRRGRLRGVAAGAVFLLVAGALYASTMFVVLAAVLRTLSGRRAVFWITPKSAARPGQVLGMLRAELVLVPVLAMLSVVASGTAVSSLAPVGVVAMALAFAAPGLRSAVGGAGGVPSGADVVAPT